MAGEIHALIPREDALRMWKPYGERVIGDLDGSLDPDNITPFEAVQVAVGALPKTQSEIYGCYYQEDDERDWIDGLRDAVEHGASDDLTGLLAESQIAQQKRAEKQRIQAIEGGAEFVALLGSAATKLVDVGVLSISQVELVHSWLVGPDGAPYMQYTPMSQLEYGRLAMKYEHDEPDLDGTDYTDFSLGILSNAMRYGPAANKKRAHCKVHESVHGSFAGLEVWDITREDGWRYPQAAVIGNHAFEPTTKISAGDDYSGAKNLEISEGWTDFVAQELMYVDPALGKSLPNNLSSHSGWAEKARQLKDTNPGLFRVIADSSFVEATPQNPNAKREALADMHDYADRVLGCPAALTELFVGAGGSLLDVYTKGRDRS